MVTSVYDVHESRILLTGNTITALYIHTYIHLCVCLCVCMSVCLSVRLLRYSTSSSISIFTLIVNFFHLLCLASSLNLNNVY